MSRTSQLYLELKLVEAAGTVRKLLEEIYEIEADTQMPDITKLSRIQKIRAELTKVNVEIDNVKKEITLLNSYRVN
jgi:hypothetical protein